MNIELFASIATKPAFCPRKVELLALMAKVPAFSPRKLAFVAVDPSPAGFDKPVAKRLLPFCTVIGEVKLCKLVVEITPFTLEVNIPVEVENDAVLFEITDDVAVTPLIVVVRVLPVRDWVKLLIMLATEERAPLTSVVRLFPVEVATLLLIILLVATEPPIFEVRVLLVFVRVFGTERLVTEREEMLVVASVLVPLTVRLPLLVVLPFTVRLPVVVVANCAVPVAVILPVTTCPAFMIFA